MSRLHRIHADLGHFVEAYSHGAHMLHEAESTTPLRSPSYEGARRSGKPESRTPSAADPVLRCALIVACQRLADAVRLLVPLSDTQGWEPLPLAHTYVLTRNPRSELLRCDTQGRVAWKDPEDPTTPILPPFEVSMGVAVARGLFSALHGRWDDLDDGDRETVEDAASEAERAIYQLRVRAKVWSRPEPSVFAKVCSRKGCWREVTSGDVCQACRQKDYRERKKGEAA